MATKPTAQPSKIRPGFERLYGDDPYGKAVLGFRNYWYPIRGSHEIGKQPLAVRLLGDEIALVKRSGKVYAMADECPHRGARLSIGKDEFPGTDTLSCRYHGWVFDVKTGACMAALAEGPESAIPGKVKVKVYPTEEHKGIVWIWMGDMNPVPIEDDVPRHILEPEFKVKFRHPVFEGNWRAHAENPDGGHQYVLHRDSGSQILSHIPAHPTNPTVYYSAEEDEHSKWLISHPGEVVRVANYPGLGSWPKPRPWRRASSFKFEPVHGIPDGNVALRLPGILRVVNSPYSGWVYHEYYIPIDEDHYLYFQIDTYRPKSVWNRLVSEIKYAVWGRPWRRVRFNNQDASVMRDVTAFIKRQGLAGTLSPLAKGDKFHFEFRKMANEQARGVGTKWGEQQTNVNAKAVPADEVEIKSISAQHAG